MFAAIPTERRWRHHDLCHSMQMYCYVPMRSLLRENFPASSWVLRLKTCQNCSSTNCWFLYYPICLKFPFWLIFLFLVSWEKVVLWFHVLSLDDVRGDIFDGTSTDKFHNEILAEFQYIRLSYVAVSDVGAGSSFHMSDKEIVLNPRLPVSRKFPVHMLDFPLYTKRMLSVKSIIYGTFCELCY